MIGYDGRVLDHQLRLKAGLRAAPREGGSVRCPCLICTWKAPCGPGRRHVISPDFPLELTGFSQGKPEHLIHFSDFRNFVLDNCILDFDAEQVYLQPQVTNLKNKEVTANSKPQTLDSRA